MSASFASFLSCFSSPPAFLSPLLLGEDGRGHLAHVSSVAESAPQQKTLFKAFCPSDFVPFSPCGGFQMFHMYRKVTIDVTRVGSLQLGLGSWEWEVWEMIRFSPGAPLRVTAEGIRDQALTYV